MRAICYDLDSLDNKWSYYDSYGVETFGLVINTLKKKIRVFLSYFFKRVWEINSNFVCMCLCKTSVSPHGLHLSRVINFKLLLLLYKMATVVPYKIKPCGHVKIDLFIYFCPSYFNFLSLFILLFFCIKDLRLPFIILTLML